MQSNAVWTLAGTPALLRYSATLTPVPPTTIALVYTGLNDRDHAFQWLETAFRERDSQLLWIGADPQFEPLRDDQRFAALMRKMGLGG